MTPRTLSGFMELLPADQIKMERLLSTLRETYELFGFTPLDTPAIESAEVLLAKGGGETEKQIYRFMKGTATSRCALTSRCRWPSTGGELRQPGLPLQALSDRQEHAI